MENKNCIIHTSIITNFILSAIVFKGTLLIQL